MSEKINTIQSPDTDFDPSLGAYPTDYAEGIVPLDEQGNPIDPTGTLAARGDGDPGFHISGLFDEENYHNPDEATGDVASSPDEIADNMLVEVAPTELENDSESDQLNRAMGMKSDLTARWIAAIEAGDAKLAAAIEVQMLAQ
ncbi:MAG: hypothetical protein WBP12_04720 [Candidatus Saccharimonas sp.]